jgi:hypothetical protein
MSLANFSGCRPKHIRNGGQVPAPPDWPSGYPGRLAPQKHKLTGLVAACYRPSESPGRAITRNSRQRTKPFQVYQWLGGVKRIKPDSNPENRVRIGKMRAKRLGMKSG